MGWVTINLPLKIHNFFFVLIKNWNPTNNRKQKLNTIIIVIIIINLDLDLSN